MCHKDRMTSLPWLKKGGKAMNFAIVLLFGLGLLTLSATNVIAVENGPSGSQAGESSQPKGGTRQHRLHLLLHHLHLRHHHLLHLLHHRLTLIHHHTISLITAKDQQLVQTTER